jgi:hypothetical protein
LAFLLGGATAVAVVSASRFFGLWAWCLVDIILFWGASDTNQNIVDTEDRWRICVFVGPVNMMQLLGR